MPQTSRPADGGGLQPAPTRRARGRRRGGRAAPGRRRAGVIGAASSLIPADRPRPRGSAPAPPRRPRRGSSRRRVAPAPDPRSRPSRTESRTVDARLDPAAGADHARAGRRPRPAPRSALGVDEHPRRARHDPRLDRAFEDVPGRLQVARRACRCPSSSPSQREAVEAARRRAAGRRRARSRPSSPAGIRSSTERSSTYIPALISPGLVRAGLLEEGEDLAVLAAAARGRRRRRPRPDAAPRVACAPRLLVGAEQRGQVEVGEDVAVERQEALVELGAELVGGVADRARRCPAGAGSAT